MELFFIKKYKNLVFWKKRRYNIDVSNILSKEEQKIGVTVSGVSLKKITRPSILSNKGLIMKEENARKVEFAIKIVNIAVLLAIVIVSFLIFTRHICVSFILP